MEHANVWTGSQRKVSVNRKTSVGNSTIPTSGAEKFLRKFSFVNYGQGPEIPEDQGTGIQLPATFLPDFHDREAIAKLRFNYVGNTGMHFSALGIGGAGYGGIYGTVDEGKAIQSVQSALKLGLNYIDTAPWYGDGKSESLLGKALATVPRKTFYIGTKVGRYKPNVGEMFDFSAERTIRSVDESLARLRLPSVDIIQIHDLEYAPNLEIILSETLPALEKIVNSGKARFIGITGYPVNKLQEVVQKSAVPIDTVLSYCRYGLFNRDLKDVIPEFRENGVGIINASPLGMGLLSKEGPPPWHAAPESLKRAAKEAVQYAQNNGEDLGKIALKYCYRLPDIATTLVSMERPDLVRANYDACVQGLSEHENQVMHEVVKKFFIPLGRTHWENIEVTHYWENMENAGLVKPVIIQPGNIDEFDEAL
ncbi:L-galactose dehydrogenase [Hypsibius exemplaris]|uniref:L-galactose dehydrogenase n=1 Tax=Hypsibius exemplaris TaxID=2072580 RepID=A0A1W0WU09_HYPEX|nr:L-galactose dehydrogenase [Hypsibius exemplaris]